MRTRSPFLQTRGSVPGNALAFMVSTLNSVISFGSGRDPAGLLASFPLDFIKIDGAIVQGLASDPDAQAKVRGFVEAADKRKVQTIAERVENANTMAVLWQLGVQFIQGYFINAPEEVVLRAER